MNTHHNLACAYRSAGRLAEAIDLHEQTLTDCEGVLDAAHPLTERVRASLAAVRGREQ
ncbi:tetratricopeptide repeat protein (plasmid) [Nocardia sp. CWNU-33]|uniref:tetratricopeptide repeat protein n=1 Tax=Nocardia sp. CWNU-33 TaxID=3392117 RepID=UPI00398EF133